VRRLSEYLDVVSVDGIGVCIREKRLLKAFRNKSVHSCLVKVTYFQVASYAAISTENDVAFCKG
jgi:methionine aminotransferase